MKTLKQLVLASVLTVFAFGTAQAGSMSVSGSMEVTNTSGLSGTTNGGGLGMENELSVTASTELDNGVGVAYKQSITADNARNDSEVVFSGLPMIGGSIAMTSTGTPIDALDNIMPTAAEESNHGAGTGNFSQIGANDGSFGLRYKNAELLPLGMTLDAMYFPQSGAGDAANDEAGSGTSHELYGDAYELALSMPVPMVDGASLTAGYANTDAASVKRDDREEYVAAVKYAYGPVSVGYQKTLLNNSFKDGQAGGEAWVKGTMYGVSYSVNDNLAVSYQMNESQKKISNGSSSGQSDKQEASGFSVSYSIGGMSLAYVDNSFDNHGYNASVNKDYKQVVLGVAF
jgi:hypothetical protein